MMGMIGVPANIDHHIPIQHIPIFLKQTGYKQEMYTPTCISSPIVPEQVDRVKLIPSRFSTLLPLRGTIVKIQNNYAIVTRKK